MPPKKQQKKEQQKKGTATPETAPKPAPLSWPRLAPVLPSCDLEFQTVLEGQILTIPKFFTAALCNTYLSFLQKSVPLTTTPGKPKRGEAVRVNDRFQISDETFARALWEQSGLKDMIERESDDTKASLWGGKVVGLNPNIRIYRYTKGQFFDKHCSIFLPVFSASIGPPDPNVREGPYIDDDSNVLPSFEVPGESGSVKVPCETTWTLLIYLTGLNDGVVGGETVFYTEATKTKRSEEIAVEPEKGLALLHKHGQDCMLHEGKLVTEDGGVGKWVLRSDLVVRR